MVIQLLSNEMSKSNLKDFDDSNKNSKDNSRFASNKSLGKVSLVDRRLEDIYTDILEQSVNDQEGFKGDAKSKLSNIVN